MNTENLSTLKIHKLTQAQYDRELEAGRIDPTALYLTPDTVKSSLLLRSRSGMKIFEITVNDNGVLTAIEVQL